MRRSALPMPVWLVAVSASVGAGAFVYYTCHTCFLGTGNVVSAAAAVSSGLLWVAASCLPDDRKWAIRLTSLAAAFFAAMSGAALLP